MKSIAVWGQGPLVHIVSTVNHDVRRIDLTLIGLPGDMATWSQFALDESADGDKLLIWNEELFNIWEVNPHNGKVRILISHEELERELRITKSNHRIGHGTWLSVNEQSGLVAFNIPAKERQYYAQDVRKSLIVVFNPDHFTFTLLGEGVPLDWTKEGNILVWTRTKEVGHLQVKNLEGEVVAARVGIGTASVCSGLIMILRDEQHSIREAATARYELLDGSLKFVGFGPIAGDLRWGWSKNLTVIKCR